MRKGILGDREVTLNERDYGVLLHRFSPEREVKDYISDTRIVCANCLCSYYGLSCKVCPLDRGCGSIINFYDPNELMAWRSDGLWWYWEEEDKAQAIRAAVYKDLLAFTKVNGGD